MSQINRILENLNEQQLQTVTTTEGYVRVIAGAGSGKTKALTSRFAYLVEELGINASNILCVTFTNKAANEMRNRVKRLIGDKNDYGYITTYHGFCVKVLREDINKVQYPKQFIIMDVEDQKTILREVYDELGINSKETTFKQSIKYISIQKMNSSYIDYLAENKDIKVKRTFSKYPETNNFQKEEGDKNSCDEILLKDSPILNDKIFFKYLEKQRRNFALDFDDLINFALYIFDHFSDVLEKWQKRLYYIQVDETQDSSPKQFYLVDLLSQVHKNLFIVGDPDQTIYEWRGAKPELLVDFDKKYPNTQTVIMNQNYRSTPNILNLGNYIIKNNKIRVDKDMFTNNKEGVDVVHFHAKSDLEEGLFVANEIQQFVKTQNLKYSDFAILYRANHVSRTIEQSFIKEQIPYSIWGGIRFFERKEIKDILSYLRLIVYGDDLSFLRVINTPKRKLGNKWIADIKQLAEQNRTSFFETVELNPLKKQSAIEFVSMIKDFRIRKDEIIISDLVQEVLDKTGLIDMYRTDGDEEKLENIKELQNAIIALENDDVEKLTLENYLQEIALYTDMDVDDSKNDRVKLMTIHTSKGLEFPYVFLCGFTDGILPSFMSLKEKRIEEERRLTYVAITRAEKAFYMTESEGYNFQTGMNKYPSRFLWEIKENLYVRQGFLPQEIINEAKSQIEYEKELKNLAPIPVFEVGDVVEFSSWGKGKVISKDDLQKTYLIYFDELKGDRPIRYDWRGLKKIEFKEENIILSESIKEDRLVETPTENLVEYPIEEPVERLIENSVGSDMIISEDLVSEMIPVANKTEIKNKSFLSNVKEFFKMKK